MTSNIQRNAEKRKSCSSENSQKRARAMGLKACAATADPSAGDRIPPLSSGRTRRVRAVRHAGLGTQVRRQTGPRTFRLRLAGWLRYGPNEEAPLFVKAGDALNPGGTAGRRENFVTRCLPQNLLGQAFFAQVRPRRPCAAPAGKENHDGKDRSERPGKRV